MRIQKKEVNSRFYYYLEESIRLEKPKVFSVYLGTKIPAKDKLKKYEKELENKIYSYLYSEEKNAYLTKKELIELKKQLIRFENKEKKFSKSKRDEKEEIGIINFVYTTLTTEGIPITKEDANLAYKLSKKKIKKIRDEALAVSLDMINGLRMIKTSKVGISLDFVEDLHLTIMSEYKDKHPGKLRTKKAYIYLRDYQKVEEIKFKPTEPKNIKKELDELVHWYNENVKILNAVELAAILHLKFYMIHPFEDGNKRVSRLLLNKALFDKNYPILNISKSSSKYFDALIGAVEKKDEKKFVLFVYESFLQKCKE